jgi:hypothetical protein
MKYPAEIYTTSPRPYKGLSDLEYPKWPSKSGS